MIQAPKFNKFLAFLGALFFFGGNLPAEVRLPHLVSDGMVLQREQPIRIWGWADAGEEVTVDINGKAVSGQTNAEGLWEVNFPAMEAGGPYTIEVAGGNTFTLQDVWVGDVWLCSGQSNMEQTMARVEPMFPDEVQQANNPEIRYFDVPDAYDFSTEQDDVKGGKWIQVDQEHIREFSAVAYFFARQLNQKYDVPIGLINASVGGSPIQSWIREEELQLFPEDYQEAVEFQNPDLIKQIEEMDRERIKVWQNMARRKDEGYAHRQVPWYSPDFDPEGWMEMERLGLLPLKNDRAVNGVYWFRKEIYLDDPKVVDQTAKLLMGTLIDSDSTYVNGQLVGTTGYRYPPRRYEVPKGVLKPGKNVITVRLINERGQGGFVEEKPYQLEIDGRVIDLKEDWEYRQGAWMPELPGQTFVRWKPLGLYNAMIAPVQQFTVKGIIWYQGESNTGKPGIYAEQMEALIAGWRKAWGKPDLPFLYIQLPNFMEPSEQPQESNWAALREAQRQVSLDVPHIGMAVAIDAGEANDIHPLDKKTVGNRLALLAFKVAYSENIKGCSAPMIKEARANGNEVVLTFDNQDGTLKTRHGDAPKAFAVAGEDGVFYWARTRIEEGKVFLASDKVPRPTTVRYAWGNNPVHANLVNEEGIPVSPFEISVNE